MYEKLIDYVSNILCENNTVKNAVAFDHEVFEHYKHVKVVFHKNHKELYASLLAFCSENNLIVLETNPATYSTIVRIED